MPKTSIEWTDYSWPVVNGCRRKSAGCGTGRAGGCYAERLAATRLKHTDRYRGLAVMTDKGPQWTGETRLIEKELEMPLRLRKPSRIFVADMGDLFFEGVPFEVIDRVFAVMLLAPQHTFQVLTKRPERMREYLSDPALYDRLLAAAEPFRRARPKLTGVGISNPTLRPPSWIWLGVSVEDQQTADERIPLLLDTPAAVRWVSQEPQIGPVTYRLEWLPGCPDFSAVGGQHTPLLADCDLCAPRASLSWVVIGGESGPRSRPFDLQWARNTVEACRAAGVKAFVKQLGARPHDGARRSIRDRHGVAAPWLTPERAEELVPQYLDGRVEPAWLRLKSKKGSDPAEWPEGLAVREMPEVRRAG